MGPYPRGFSLLSLGMARMRMVGGSGEGVLGLTKLVAVLSGGGDAAPGDLHVLAAGPAVELVLANLPPAQLVSHGTLVPHVLVKIRRRVILPLCGYQGKNSVNLLWVTPSLVHAGEGYRGTSDAERPLVLPRVGCWLWPSWDSRGQRGGTEDDGSLGLGGQLV